jgi:hypothetical protein
LDGPHENGIPALGRQRDQFDDLRHSVPHAQDFARESADEDLEFPPLFHCLPMCWVKDHFTENPERDHTVGNQTRRRYNVA